VSGKEDKQDMARMIRKNETGTTAAKPAARRNTAATPAAGAAKVTTRRRTTTEPGAAPGLEPTYDQIALRAYHIFLRRGTAHGHAADDWFQARAELLQERGPKA
jgi:hypothetical protein